MASRTLISKLSPLISTVPSSLFSSAALRTSSLLRLRPLAAAAADLVIRRSPFTTSSTVRCFSSRPTVSSLNDPSPNFSNRPPKETILLDGCDFEHWLVVVDPPDPDMNREQIIDSYIKTLAQVVGSEEEAKMKIYSVSTKHYFAFGALVSEELSYKIKSLPKVRWVLPDSYLDVKNKDYGGEPFIDGRAAPYDPKYHEEWVRNNSRANERSRRNDRPRNSDRSRNFERRRDAGAPMPNQDFQRAPPSSMAPPNAAAPPSPPNQMPPPRENPNMGGGLPNRNVPPVTPPPPQYQNSVPNAGYQGGGGYPPQGGAPAYPGGTPGYQGGPSSYQGGPPGGYQGGNQGHPSYQGGGGAQGYQGGNPPYQGGGGGSPGYQGGPPPYQGGGGGGNPAFQGGGGGGGSTAYQGGSGGGGGNPGYQNYSGGNPGSYQSGGYPGGAGGSYQSGGNAYQGEAPNYQGRDLPGRDK